MSYHWKIRGISLCTSFGSELNICTVWCKNVTTSNVLSGVQFDVSKGALNEYQMLLPNFNRIQALARRVFFGGTFLPQKLVLYPLIETQRISWWGHVSFYILSIEVLFALYGPHLRCNKPVKNNYGRDPWEICERSARIKPRTCNSARNNFSGWLAQFFLKI